MQVERVDKKTGEFTKVPASKSFLSKCYKAYIYAYSYISQRLFDAEIKKYEPASHSDPKQTEEYTKFILKGLGIREAELPEFLSKYFKQMPEDSLLGHQKKENLMDRAFFSINPKWLCLLDKTNTNVEELKGLCVFCTNIENQNIEILHLSTIPGIENEILILKLLDYIQEKISANIKIRIKLSPGEEKIKKILKENYKNSILEDIKDIKDESYIVFQNKNEINNNNISKQCFGIKIAHFIALGKEKDKEPIQTEKRNLFWAPGNILNILMQINCSSIPESFEKDEKLKSIAKTIPDTKFLNSGDLNKINISLENQNIKLPSLLQPGEEV